MEAPDAATLHYRLVANTAIARAEELISLDPDDPSHVALLACLRAVFDREGP